MMMMQTAELNRDRKKQRKPFNIEDFYLYAERSDESLPSSRYGAAAMKLTQMNQLPTWALFVFHDLKKVSVKANPPELLAFIGDDVIILAPSVSPQGCKGMLIAQSTASRSIRSLVSPCGKEIRIITPVINQKFYAEEDVVLDVVSYAPSGHPPSKSEA
jgi:hypothetical protein